jgi:hypothetical protein
LRQLRRCARRDDAVLVGEDDGLDAVAEAELQQDVRDVRLHGRLETNASFAPGERRETNRKATPNPFRLAVIAKAHLDVVRLPFPTAWLQKLGLALGAPLGRLLGYRPAYEPATLSEVSLAL